MLGTSLRARPRELVALLVGQSLLWIAAGLAMGLALAWGVTRFLSSLLYGVSPTDPVTFSSIALLLGGVALLASYFPARRAARVDPLIVLRTESWPGRSKGPRLRATSRGR